MAHALAPDLGPGDLYSATVADHATVPDALVLTAKALPVLGRAEKPFAKKAVFLRDRKSVV
jgi:hypothetical protein